MSATKNLDGFLKNCIIAFHILNSVADSVYGHDVQKSENTDKYFAPENISTGQKDRLVFCIADHDHCIHQCILVIWGKNDGLIIRNVMKVDHGDLPVINMETQLRIPLE